MRGERQVLEAVAFAKLEKLRCDALGVLEICVLGHPVVALLMKQARQIE